MIKGIGHAALTVADMQASLHFYYDVLGFEKAFEIHDDNDQPWIIYIKVGGGQFIELFYGGVHKKPEVDHLIGYDHLCLEVDDIQTVADHLTEKGWPLLIKPQQGKDLNYQCWVKDPDGNRIEFMQLDPDSPQAKAYK
ncbi:lactoylglutathione lyase [Pullulanibacillus camelliae]|uniref:Lactoylglutathione lyase n=1 Tax=Pullulanibacillus camelliae TaxID=1707096 RepID=A0A8J2YJW6_9BACL|nr:VOC family protein [Pullulanibacillus camelliae]GGE49322.1 lactoylglutathione lyase [Pullulanibacillus camelliae]